MENVELKRKVTLKRKGGDENKPQPSKSKWWPWLLLALIAIVAVVFFLPKNSSSEDTNQTVSGKTEQATVEEAVKAPEPVNEKTPEAETETPEAVPAAEPENKPAEQTQPPANPTPDAKTVSTHPQGAFDEKAKQVIRGDYGNGTARKQALGSEYDKIQTAVNEIYRKGLVK